MGRRKQPEPFPDKVEPLLHRGQWEQAHERAEHARAAGSANVLGQIRDVLYDRRLGRARSAQDPPAGGPAGPAGATPG